MSIEKDDGGEASKTRLGGVGGGGRWVWAIGNIDMDGYGGWISGVG